MFIGVRISGSSPRHPRLMSRVPFPPEALDPLIDFSFMVNT